MVRTQIYQRRHRCSRCALRTRHNFTSGRDVQDCVRIAGLSEIGHRRSHIPFECVWVAGCRGTGERSSTFPPRSRNLSPAISTPHAECGALAPLPKLSFCRANLALKGPISFYVYRSSNCSQSGQRPALNRTSHHGGKGHLRDEQFPPRLHWRFPGAWLGKSGGIPRASRRFA